MSSHEACCDCCSNSPLEASESSSEDDGSPSHPPTPVPPASFTIIINTPEGPVPVPNSPPWLITALQHPDVPSKFTGELYSLVLLDCHLLARTVTAVKLVFMGIHPLYLGIQGDKTLNVSTWAECSLVATTFKLPADSSVPMDCP
ncbi:hypothetical protein F5141DRAFT_1067346 [Pisolithus sp. B1]|nr:hypothetical protein F5141DRAFT_1067346 [Pisolithus sp. B1]